MEVIGRAPGGGAIVKLSADELESYDLLRRAVENHCLRSEAVCAPDPCVDFDYAGVLGAVRGYALARFQLNNLKALVGTFERFLAPPSDAPDHITDGPVS